jgi:hypothetical protein
MQTAIALSAAYIAYVILYASPRQVWSIIPVRIIARSAGNPRLSGTDITNAWALLLGICADKDNRDGDQDGDDTNNITFSLLPLRLDVYGSRQVYPKRSHADFPTPFWFRHKDVIAKFDGVPVMPYNDVELCYEPKFAVQWRDSWAPSSVHLCSYKPIYCG